MKTYIERPIITEKTLEKATKGIFTFACLKEARKEDIKSEVEKTFEVHVLDVHTMIMHGKTRRTGKRRTPLKHSDWKKAIVTLKPGEKISLFDVQS
jgi:large subunit ribosomal protein L23